MIVGRVAELWRYPVKSMRGERVDALELLDDGIAHDRRYGVESSGAPRGKPMLTSRERAAMLLQRAAVEDGQTVVTLQTGARFPIADPLLPGALEAEMPQEHILQIVRSPRPLTDVRPIALLSLETMEQLSRELGRSIDARRFRANIVLTATFRSESGFPEDMLLGQTLQISSIARLRVTERIPRCRMVTFDPVTAEPDVALMKHLDRRHEGRLGVYAAPVAPGPLRVGDAVCIAG